MTNSTTAPAANTSVVAASKNVLSIVAFVLSLVGFNVVAVILGFVGLSQIKKNGQGGRGFAIAAIIIGLVSIVFFVVIFGSAIIAASTGELITE